MKRKMNSGDEVNAFTKWRHVYFWRPGERKAIKRGANRRERHEAAEEIRKGSE